MSCVYPQVVQGISLVNDEALEKVSQTSEIRNN